MWCELCLLTLWQATISCKGPYFSLDKVVIIGKLFFDSQVEIALFSAKTDKVNGTIRTDRKMEFQEMFLLHTGAASNIIP